MGVIASQITSLTIVYAIVYSGTDKRKHQSSASLVFVRGIHRGPVNSPHKGPVTRKMFHRHLGKWGRKAACLRKMQHVFIVYLHVFVLFVLEYILCANSIVLYFKPCNSMPAQSMPYCVLDQRWTNTCHWTHDVIITSLYNVKTTSFLRNNDVIIVWCVCWDGTQSV